jgi:hypothetical protein
MSAFTSLLTPGFTALHALMDDAFTVVGQAGPLTGTFDAEREESVFEEMGQRTVVRRTCVTFRSLWTSPPSAQSRNILTYDGNEYVVTAVATDALHYMLTLEKRT